ncbi:MAG: MFS transporter [Muribaculaceae bacterium]|nr:MFS transporter [Muribaculaceae bacterium]
MREISMPKRKWVPKWIGVITLFLILLNIVLVNGAYLGSSVDVSSALGSVNEDIMMSFYACSVGMVIANPLVQKVRQIMTTKTLLLIDIALQCAFSLICAKTTSMPLMICCCFLIGMLKTFLLLEFIILTSPLFTPRNVRSESYSWFYPLVFGGGQFSIPLTAWIAYNYTWQHTYYFVIILLLLTMAMIALFFRDARPPKMKLLKEINFRSIFLISISYLVLAYAFIYGKMLDWTNSDLVMSLLTTGVCLLGIFIYHQTRSEKPYISFRPIKNMKSVIGYLFMFFCVFFNSDTALVNGYITGVLGIDNIHANLLVLWTVPGYIIAGVIAFWWFRLQRWRFRYLVSTAMWMYTLYFGFLYWGITPYSAYQSLFVPMIIKGFAFMTLVISFGVYAAEDVDSPYLVSNTFFMISTRSVFAPVISMASLSTMLYHAQVRSMTRLAEYFTPEIMQPDVTVESLYNFVNLQSHLASTKTVLGYLLIASTILAAVSAITPFHKALRIPILKAGQDMA